MSITEELREYVQGWRETPNLMDDLDAGDIDGILGDFEHIADRIDAKHERAVMSAMNDALYHANDKDMAELGWIRLPKDADGEYIHIGDVMDSKVDYLFGGEPFTVRGLVLCEGGWEAADGRFGNRYEPDSLRHHHDPTVEDVLREFADRVCNSGHQWGLDAAGTIAEYAAKLRLAEE